MTTAVIPRAPVAMAIMALIPPAMLDLLSFLSIQHIRIHPSTYGNKAFFHLNNISSISLAKSQLNSHVS